VPGRLQEREGALQVIVDALGAAAGGRGRAVVVSGAAGIGKTSLLDVAREAAHDRNFAVASARGSDLETAYPWGVVRQLLEPRLRGMSAEARTRALAGSAALAGPVVLPETAPETDGESFGVLHGLYWLVAGLAAQRPQLLVVDDLHWADGASVRFLEFLVNRLDEVPAVLLAARRPEADGALRGAPLVTPVALAPLSPAAIAAMLSDDGDVPVSDAFVQACHGATGGNPLLIRRLADGLRVRDVDAVARLGPYAIADAVGATVARLGEGPSRLAEAVAVLERAPLITAAQLAGIDAREAAAFGERLARAGILRDARPLEFEHALVRDAVMSGLSAGERARLHASAARILADAGAAPEAVAMHLLHAEPRGDSAVAATLTEAGRRGLASGALEEAAACLARALDEPPPREHRSPLLIDLARAEQGLGRAESIDRVLEASDAAVDEVQRARAALALMWASGPGRQDPRAALAMVEEAVAGVAGRHRELELELEGVRLMAAFMSPALMEHVLGTAERFADLEGRTPGEAGLLLHVALHRFLLGRSAAVVAEPLDRAVRDPELVAAIGPESAWLYFTLGGLYKADRLDDVNRTVEIGLAEARRRGSATGFGVASLWRAWTSLRAGAAAEAEADARAAFEALPAGMWQRLPSLACLVEVLVERGATDEAEEVLEAAGPIGADPGAAALLDARSILRAARGDARGALDDQLESRRQTGDESLYPYFDGWLRIALMSHRTGDGATAEREAPAALEWARVWDTPGHLGQALAVSGLILGGDEGLARLREAVALLERSPARRDLAHSLVALGAALRRRGERTAAREPLRRALDIATAGGLGAIAERAREELRVSGAKIQRPASSGLDSLTPSERRIAELAAGGASNPEIAQALFVTVKTVEMHLGNAYRKLDIGSRRELRPLLRKP
jgi:DNA-binding CsgD family transcriptional regulator